MAEVQNQIAALQHRIRRDMQRLRELKQAEFERQRAERRQYLSSREVAALIKAYTGKAYSMTTIKRWADKGYLGEVYEERRRFPDLPSTRGNKRFLFHRAAIYRYLQERGLLKPRFDVLDRVRLVQAKPHQREAEQIAVVITVELADEKFVYTLQLEENGRIIQKIPEEQLLEVADER